MASDLSGSAGDVWAQFQEKKHEPEYVRNVLIGLAAIMGLLTVPFAICTCVVAGTAAAGAGAVLTALALLAWEAGSIALMQRGPAALSQGFLMGASLVMTALTFETAVFWGQLAQCDDTYSGDVSLARYSCAHRGAMRGACAFAVLIWLVQLPFVALAVAQRHVLIGGGSSGYAPAGVDPYRYSYTQVPSAVVSFGGSAALSAEALSGAPGSSSGGGGGGGVAGAKGPVYDL